MKEINFKEIDFKETDFKEIDFNINESPFSNFFTSRFSISSKIDAKNAWNFSKENNLSFFVVSLGCLLSGLNSVPELRRRIIDNKVIEFDYIDGITPVMDENEDTYKEIRVVPPSKFKSKSSALKKWHDYVLGLRDSVLKGRKKEFSVAMTERDSEPIANFSCSPWLDFDTLTPCISEPHQIQPLITWGKLTNKKKISVAISFNHIFVHGKQIGAFYDNVQKYFNNPEII